jgi:hypothetical protein
VLRARTRDSWQASNCRGRRRVLERSDANNAHSAAQSLIRAIYPTDHSPASTHFPLPRSFTATTLCGYLIMSPPGGLDGNLFLVAIGARHAVDRNFRRAAWTPASQLPDGCLPLGRRTAASALATPAEVPRAGNRRGYSGEPSPRSELNANVLSRGWLTVMAAVRTRKGARPLACSSELVL